MSRNSEETARMTDQMQIIMVPVSDLMRDPRNARKHSKKNLDAIRASLLTNGFQSPIVIDANNVVLKGNGTTDAAESLGIESVPCVRSDLSGADAALYAIADNRTGELAEWDLAVLPNTLAALRDDPEIDHLASGFDEDEIANLVDQITAGSGGDRGPAPEGAAMVPWTTVLDARQGYWQDRKAVWKASGIDSELGRDANPFNQSGWGGDDSDSTTEKIVNLRGTTSIFDPVLCEILYGWFCPSGGSVLDPFAGGSVRGIVAAEMGLEYTGMDLSKKQLDANWAQVLDREMPGVIHWAQGDSRTDLPDGAFDFVMTCPPYFDLEVYSDADGDLSNMKIDGFRECYGDIIEQCALRLKKDRFAAIVIGEVRAKDDGNGYMRGLYNMTVDLCEQHGLRLYNDAVLITPLGTVQMACINPFKKTRKLGRSHQYVLVFCNGDVRAATAACGGDDVPMLHNPADVSTNAGESEE